MKYYVIEKFVDYGRQIAQPLCVVEKEEIAKDLVKRYNGLAYFEYETEENNIPGGYEHWDLEQILDSFGIHNGYDLIDTLKNIRFLEKQNAINSKKLRALDIIKKIDKTALLHLFAVCVKDQEEYELLKEVLL